MATDDDKALDATAGIIKRNEKEAWWAKIYRPITRCAELPDGAFRVYCFLMDMTNPYNEGEQNVVFPGQTWLAKQMKKRRPTVNQNIKILEAFGLITIVKVHTDAGYDRNEYVIHKSVGQIPPEFQIEGDTRKKSKQKETVHETVLEAQPVSDFDDTCDKSNMASANNDTSSINRTWPSAINQTQPSAINRTLRRPNINRPNEEDPPASRQAGEQPAAQNTASPTARPLARLPVGMEKLAEELCKLYGYQQLPKDWIATLITWQTEAHPPDHYERLIRWVPKYRDKHGGELPTQEQLTTALQTIARGENGNGRHEQYGVAGGATRRRASSDGAGAGTAPTQPYRSRYGGGITRIQPRNQREGISSGRGDDDSAGASNAIGRPAPREP